MNKEEFHFKIFDRLICINDCKSTEGLELKRGQILTLFGYGGGYISLSFTTPEAQRFICSVEDFIKVEDWRESQLNKIL